MKNEYIDKNANQIYSLNKERLSIILNKLCEGIEAPTPRIEENNHDNNKRLLEIVETNSYPYPTLHCPHLEEKGIGEDCVECQHLQYETYKKRFLELTRDKGLAHTHTLKAAFDYYSTLITQYKLTECDELLDEIYETCLERGNWSAYYILAIQSRAFLRFKQNKYLESLEYFEKQLNHYGPNEKIYENMALVYSRLNRNKEAAQAYAQAILLIQQFPVEQQSFSTLLMGLATVLENVDDALVVLNESMHLLKERFDKPHSLMAKTLGAIGDLYMKKNDYIAAKHYYNQAVNIFIETCGLDSPLTSNAMNKEANCLFLLGEKEKAYDVILNSLKVWAQVDNYSFSANAVCEALMLLKDSNKTPEEVISILESLQNKIINNPILANDINTLCLLKFIYEIYIIKHDIPRAILCCKIFKDCLNKLDGKKLGEYLSFRDQFLQDTVALLAILESITKI